MNDVLRRRDLDEFRADFHAELKQDFAELKLDLAELQTRLIIFNVATALAVGGLVLAAFKLA
jgi:hypothetical protein